MDEDIFFIGSFFFTTIVLALGIPLVRSWTRRRDAEPPTSVLQMDERLARMETAIDTMAVEVERISESQRFLSKLLAERTQAPVALPRNRES